VPVTIRPIIVTADLDRLLAFYAGLFGAREIFRYPDDGPVFSVGLALGDSELNIVADERVEAGSPGRMLLSIEVPDVAHSSSASPPWLGTSRDRRTTCRGGSALPTSATRTATTSI
jgi:catechol 2,3-dioxygenase-like lactoylglutathione lyase family enzyme